MAIALFVGFVEQAQAGRAIEVPTGALFSSHCRWCSYGFVCFGTLLVSEALWEGQSICCQGFWKLFPP